MIMDLTRTWYCRKTKIAEASSFQTSPNGFPTPDTGRGSIRDDRNVSESCPFSAAETHSLHTPIGDMDNIDPASNSSSNTTDPFAFMRDMDLNMDQFLDMGIWGHESYEGMGFGGSMPF